MSEQDSILCMYYLIFNHSSIDGHLGCFRVLALVNNTVMNIDMKISFQVFLPSLSKYPEVEVLDHMIVLSVIFEENSIAFTTVAAPIYIPTSNAQGFCFLHICTSTCYFQAFGQ